MKRKYLRKLWPGAIALFVLAACADDSRLDFVAEKPESIAELEYLDDYDVLKTYVNRSTDPDFKLGAGVSVSDFTKKGLAYSLVVSNFDEMTAGWEMKHGGVVQTDGSLDLSQTESFIAAAREAGITIYGHTLCWHANQSASWLNSTIAPTVVPGNGEPTWDLVTGADFETDDASNYQSNSNALMSFTADGEGADGEGRALKIINEEVRENDWNSQFFVTFSPAMEAGETYELSLDVRADVAASFSTQAHGEPGSYIYWDFFGSVSATTEWTTFTKQITVSDDLAGTKTIAFNLGNTATAYYLDNIRLSWYNESGGSQTIEKTAEEKREIIAGEMERWISGMLEVSKDYIKAWDVVNEPMDDGNPYEIKTGAGKSLAGDEFYWQDYLGKDYAVTAFSLARQYGNSDDLLFINDYNLEYDLDKCRGLIAYVEYIESKGVRVDGIGTQMHISTDSDKEQIARMFELLAETGKQIKISELDIGVGVTTDQATDEDYKAQSEMYQYVAGKYVEIIPAAQRYGITVWSPNDSPAGSSWRAGEPVGLWTEGYSRKRAYAGFADGLAGEE